MLAQVCRIYAGHFSQFVPDFDQWCYVGSHSEGEAYLVESRGPEELRVRSHF